MATELYTHSEDFRKGWVAGFYDARTDECLRYLDEILRYGLRTEKDQAFFDGYRMGRQFRVGRTVRQWSFPAGGVEPNRSAPFHERDAA
jgi:hypothetical protein